MGVSFHNSLTRQIEPFEQLEPGKVRMYSCGPTVYDFAHIGNWRANLFVDLLRRYLEYRGFETHHVMNLTDVDNKTINGARERGVSLSDYTGPFVEAFFDDLDTLRIRRAHLYPRATEHVEGMIGLIVKLEEKGMAYRSEGSVYYAVDRFQGYGKLSRVDVSELRTGVGVDADEYEKEEARDFVLWKGRKPEDGDVYWESPFGEGRPGWHLECSAMSDHYLQVPFDIHTGGVDLLFPHHENEIAQTEGATGSVPARFWLHNEHLLVEGQKMSKSLGNQFTLRDLLDLGADPVAIRYLLMGTHYRQQLNFRRAGLAAAAASVERLRAAARLWRERVERKDDPGALVEDAKAVAEETTAAFIAAMDADLNISEGLSAVFDLVRRGNALLDEGLGANGAEELLDALAGFDDVLDVVEEGDQSALPDDLREAIEHREEARRNKEWAEADRLREELLDAGVVVEDTPDGPRWKWVGSQG
jgi:cysteinyl-tRNA synthetase